MSQSVKDTAWLKRLCTALFKLFDLTAGRPITFDARGWLADSTVESELGYTPEDSANKVTAFQQTPDDDHYASEKLTKDYVDGRSLAPTSLAKVTQRIQHSDLTDAVNGEAEAVNVGTALPANAVVIGHELKLDTQFSGGGATSVNMSLGASDDIASLGSGFRADTQTAGKSYSPGYEHATSHGTHNTGNYSGKQIVATFTPDGAHALDGLTAGDLTVTVWYIILA